MTRDWHPDVRTQEAIHSFVETLLSRIGEIVGVDETIPGCEVVATDPYAAAIIPRLVRVALRGSATTGYNVDVWYRGGFSINVGDFVTVIHMRDGNRYEIIGPGGPTGFVDTDHNLLSARHPDTATADAIRGYLIRGETTPEWERFPAFQSGRIVQGDGADVVSDVFDWDVVAAAGGDMVHDHSTIVEGGKNLHDIEELEFEAPSVLTINGGQITRTQVYHTVDTEGAAATDDLEYIGGGVVGDLLILQPEHDTRTIVVKHNTVYGNIWLVGKADISLDDIHDHILLIYDSAMWCNTY